MTKTLIDIFWHLIKPMPKHRHKCGNYFAQNMQNIEGCGHVFSHRDSLKKSAKDQHMCPRCGRGPWFLWWDPPAKQNVITFGGRS